MAQQGRKVKTFDQPEPIVAPIFVPSKEPVKEPVPVRK